MEEDTDWFDLCSTQNTTMTNSDSKYYLFVLFTALCAQIIHHLTSKMDLDTP